MSQQAFEGAQPQVLRGKPKYKPSNSGTTKGFYDEEDSEQREALNIMHDKRVFRGNTHNMNLIQSNLTAQQKDELRIKEEQERKKIEMIKTQLLQYKRQKHKPSPYDLRPGPPARIDVDLTYFLSEQGRHKPEELEVKCQTDEFETRPETPKYVAKKTGIDKITQIEDYDLFDFDREVQPILNVLLTKNVEQSLLEVEEESELEEIRKFKADYSKRQVNLRDNWEEEVKREIQRIKHKNKALKNARAKREQQIKTMHKLQCLNLAKQFLNGCYKGTISHLAQKSQWRDSFQDQLSISYKHFLTDNTLANTNKQFAAASLINSIVSDEMNKLAVEKQNIKDQIKIKAAQKEATRVIESKSTRIVHFIFNPRQKIKETPFTKKLNLLLSGDLDQYEIEEAEKFETYLDKFVDETLQEDDAYPITYEDNHYFELELNQIKNISFAVSNNPFFKLETEKYYPEAIVVNVNGDILAWLGGDKNQTSPQYPSLKSRSNFRDEKTKINDDRKIEMSLDEFTEPGTQIIFFVRSNDLRKATDVHENTFDEAWFRFQNEQTGQTIDYTKVKRIPLPEDFLEGAADEEQDDPEAGPKARNEVIYLVGRIYKEDLHFRTKKPQESKWIYEKWNQVVTSAKFPEIQQTLASLYKSSIEQIEDQKDQIAAAQQKLIEAAEERRQAAIAAAQKKKSAVKKGSKKEEERLETPAVNEDKNTRSISILQEEAESKFDLFIPDQFSAALKQKFGRCFTFGPVQLDGLDREINAVNVRQLIIDNLESTPQFLEASNQICVHGYKVSVKDRTLKRGTSLLKHARFLSNLEVIPIWPSEPELEQDENENDNDNDDN